MEKSEGLAESFRSLPTTPLEQTFYRVIHAKYAASALATVGSLRHGGRYNPPDAFEVLYLADNPVTALEEVGALLRTAAGLTGLRGPPRIVLSVECRLRRAVRFGRAALASLGLSREDVTEPWREIVRGGAIPITHVLGRLAFEREDLEAIVVPSARDPDRSNLVVFPAKLIEGSSIHVFDDSGIIDARLPSGR